MFSVNFNNNAPIHEQLSHKIEKLILSGVLEKDSPLPSVRELACELAINPNTVQKSYTSLEQDGITYSVNGKGRFVAITDNELKQKKAVGVFKSLEVAVEELKSYDFTLDEIAYKVEVFYKGVSKS